MAFPSYGSPSKTEPRQGDAPGLGQMLQRMMAGMKPPQPGVPEPGMSAPVGVSPQTPQAPPQTPPMMPPNPGLPGPGAPLQSAGISPQEMDAILEQVKGELMKDIAGQSGQRDRVFEASRGLASYRPQGQQSWGWFGTNLKVAPAVPQTYPSGPEDVQFPPGMSPQGLDNWRKYGNPNGPQLPPKKPTLPIR